MNKRTKRIHNQLQKNFEYLRVKELASYKDHTMFLINEVYIQLLGRPADEAGLKAYGNALKANQISLLEFVQEIQGSEEAQKKNALNKKNNTIKDKSNKPNIPKTINKYTITDKIYEIYKTLFNRLPDIHSLNWYRINIEKNYLGFNTFLVILRFSAEGRNKKVTLPLSTYFRAIKELCSPQKCIFLIRRIAHIIH